jgi:GntR family transcriptional regulator / MocR family aminotransferase
MPKNAPLLALPLPQRPLGSGLSDWLHRELRASILEGRVQPEARLPSSRSLAAQLQISRGTVTAIYERLADEGYVGGRVGDGTRVLSTWQRPVRHALTSSTLKSSKPPSARLSRRADAWAKTPFPLSQNPVRVFQANVPCVNDFPLATWTRLYSARLHRATRSLLSENDPLGYPALREAIAAHLRETRGLRCTGTQVIIVSGTQMALSLIAHLLLDPGDQVWVEDPGYPGAYRLLTAMGLTCVPSPVDAQGLRIDLAMRKAPKARLAYVTAAHQFPLGVTLSLARRAALLEWAQDHEAWIFEDDYDSEFRFSGRPLMALQGMPGGDRVLFCGSFNKVLYPGLRLGFLVVPEHLVEVFRRGRSLLDRYPASVEQAVMTDFITNGHLERHLRRMRSIYLERHETLIRESQRVWGERLVVTATDTGLQTTAWLQDGGSAKELCNVAAKLGQELLPLSAYALQAKRSLGHSLNAGVQIGFGPHTPEQLRTAIQTLSKSAW